MILKIYFLALSGVEMTPSHLYNQGTFNCISNNGAQFISWEIQQQDNANDQNYYPLLANQVNQAEQAGMPSPNFQVYVNPNEPGADNGTFFADTIINNLQGSNTDIINASFYFMLALTCQTFWNHTSCVCNEQADYIQDFLNGLDSNGIDSNFSGIYTIETDFTTCVGTSQFDKYQLWYVNNNNQANFNDFTPFGGWYQPTVKTYGSVNLPKCFNFPTSGELDLDYMGEIED